MRGKQRPKSKATALALVIAAAAFCAVPAVASAVPPDAPIGLATSPPSPANFTLPVLTGNAEAGSTVSVFDNGDCTGSLLGTIDATDFGTSGFNLSVNNDSTNTFSANAANGDGPGLCSNPITYVEDSTGPAAPSGLTTSPTSPSNNNSPFVKGTAAGDAVSVAVYANGSCSGGAAQTGGPGTFASPGLQVSVTSNTTTTLSANSTDAVGNVGGCSTINYTEDSSGPSAPTGLSTNPASPSNDSTPFLKGTVSGDSVSVSVYANASCALAPAATGSPGTFASTGLQLTVPLNTTTPLSANSTDAVGNVGGCTSINYTEDSTGPAAPTGLSTNPASPSNDNTPLLKGTVTETTATVAVFANATCSGTAASTGSPATFGASGLVVTVPSNTTTALSARATDSLGNVGGCATINYTEDSLGPVGPTDLATLPVSPANDNNPLFRGTAESGSTVSVFTNGSCSGSSLATGSAAAFAAPGGFVIHVSDNTTTTLFARATDALGNIGVCSSVGVTYVEDSALPVAPRLLTTTPGSGSNNNDPILKGVSDPGTTVAVFTNGTCSGHSFGGGSVAAFAVGFSFHVADNSINHLSARATDVALNQSACSSPLDYVESTLGPPGSGTAGVTKKKCKKKSKSASTAKKKHKKCKKKKKKN
jgi:hypothetical protein